MDMRVSLLNQHIGIHASRLYSWQMKNPFYHKRTEPNHKLHIVIITKTGYQQIYTANFTRSFKYQELLFTVYTKFIYTTKKNSTRCFNCYILTCGENWEENKKSISYPKLLDLTSWLFGLIEWNKSLGHFYKALNLDRYRHAQQQTLIWFLSSSCHPADQLPFGSSMLCQCIR